MAQIINHGTASDDSSVVSSSGVNSGPSLMYSDSHNYIGHYHYHHQKAPHFHAFNDNAGSRQPINGDLNYNGNGGMDGHVTVVQIEQKQQMQNQHHYHHQNGGGGGGGQPNGELPNGNGQQLESDFVTVLKIASTGDVVLTTSTLSNYYTPPITTTAFSNSSSQKVFVDNRRGEIEEEVTIYRLPGERLGMALRFDGGQSANEAIRKVFVQNISPDSPASKAIGLMLGILREADEILQIDGRQSSSLTRLECITLLRDAPVCIRLLVRRIIASMSATTCATTVTTATTSSCQLPYPAVTNNHNNVPNCSNSALNQNPTHKQQQSCCQTDSQAGYLCNGHHLHPSDMPKLQSSINNLINNRALLLSSTSTPMINQLLNSCADQYHSHQQQQQQSVPKKVPPPVPPRMATTTLSIKRKPKQPLPNQSDSENGYPSIEQYESTTDYQIVVNGTSNYHQELPIEAPIEKPPRRKSGTTCSSTGSNPPPLPPRRPKGPPPKPPVDHRIQTSISSTSITNTLPSTSVSLKTLPSLVAVITTKVSDVVTITSPSKLTATSSSSPSSSQSLTSSVSSLASSSSISSPTSITPSSSSSSKSSQNSLKSNTTTTSNQTSVASKVTFTISNSKVSSFIRHTAEKLHRKLSGKQHNSNSNSNNTSGDDHKEKTSEKLPVSCEKSPPPPTTTNNNNTAEPEHQPQSTGNEEINLVKSVKSVESSANGDDSCDNDQAKEGPSSSETVAHEQTLPKAKQNESGWPPAPVLYSAPSVTVYTDSCQENDDYSNFESDTDDTSSSVSTIIERGSINNSSFKSQLEQNSYFGMQVLSDVDYGHLSDGSLSSTASIVDRVLSPFERLEREFDTENSGNLFSLPTTGTFSLNENGLPTIQPFQSLSTFSNQSPPATESTTTTSLNGEHPENHQDQQQQQQLSLNKTSTLISDDQLNQANRTVNNNQQKQSLDETIDFVRVSPNSITPVDTDSSECKQSQHPSDLIKPIDNDIDDNKDNSLVEPPKQFCNESVAVASNEQHRYEEISNGESHNSSNISNTTNVVADQVVAVVDEDIDNEDDEDEDFDLIKNDIISRVEDDKDDFMLDTNYLNESSSRYMFHHSGSELILAPYSELTSITEEDEEDEVGSNVDVKELINVEEITIPSINIDFMEPELSAAVSNECFAKTLPPSELVESNNLIESNETVVETTVTNGIELPLENKSLTQSLDDGNDDSDDSSLNKVSLNNVFEFLNEATDDFEFVERMLELTNDKIDSIDDIMRIRESIRGLQGSEQRGNLEKFLDGKEVIGELMALSSSSNSSASSLDNDCDDNLEGSKQEDEEKEVKKSLMPCRQKSNSIHQLNSTNYDDYKSLPICFQDSQHQHQQPKRAIQSKLYQSTPISSSNSQLNRTNNSKFGSNGNLSKIPTISNAKPSSIQSGTLGRRSSSVSNIFNRSNSGFSSLVELRPSLIPRPISNFNLSLPVSYTGIRSFQNTRSNHNILNRSTSMQSIPTNSMNSLPRAYNKNPKIRRQNSTTSVNGQWQYSSNVNNGSNNSPYHNNCYGRHGQDQPSHYYGSLSRSSSKSATNVYSTGSLPRPSKPNQYGKSAGAATAASVYHNGHNVHNSSGQLAAAVNHHNGGQYESNGNLRTTSLVDLTTGLLTVPSNSIGRPARPSQLSLTSSQYHIGHNHHSNSNSNSNISNSHHHQLRHHFSSGNLCDSIVNNDYDEYGVGDLCQIESANHNHNNHNGSILNNCHRPSAISSLDRRHYHRHNQPLAQPGQQQHSSSTRKHFAKHKLRNSSSLVSLLPSNIHNSNSNTNSSPHYWHCSYHASSSSASSSLSNISSNSSSNKNFADKRQPSIGSTVTPANKAQRSNQSNSYGIPTFNGYGSNSKSKIAARKTIKSSLSTSSSSASSTKSESDDQAPTRSILRHSNSATNSKYKPNQSTPTNNSSTSATNITSNRKVPVVDNNRNTSDTNKNNSFDIWPVNGQRHCANEYDLNLVHSSDSENSDIAGSSGNSSDGCCTRQDQNNTKKNTMANNSWKRERGSHKVCFVDQVLEHRNELTCGLADKNEISAAAAASFDDDEEDVDVNCEDNQRQLLKLSKSGGNSRNTSEQDRFDSSSSPEMSILSSSTSTSSISSLSSSGDFAVKSDSAITNSPGVKHGNSGKNNQSSTKKTTKSSFSFLTPLTRREDSGIFASDDTSTSEFSQSPSPELLIGSDSNLKKIGNQLNEIELSKLKTFKERIAFFDPITNSKTSSLSMVGRTSNNCSKIHNNSSSSNSNCNNNSNLLSSQTLSRSCSAPFDTNCEFKEIINQKIIMEERPSSNDDAGMLLTPPQSPPNERTASKDSPIVDCPIKRMDDLIGVESKISIPLNETTAYPVTLTPTIEFNGKKSNSLSSLRDTMLSARRSHNLSKLKGLIIPESLTIDATDDPLSASSDPKTDSARIGTISSDLPTIISQESFDVKNSRTDIANGFNLNGHVHNNHNDDKPIEILPLKPATITVPKYSPMFKRRPFSLPLNPQISYGPNKQSNQVTIINDNPKPQLQQQTAPPVVPPKPRPTQQPPLPPPTTKAPIYNPAGSSEPKLPQRIPPPLPPKRKSINLNLFLSPVQTEINNSELSTDVVKVAENVKETPVAEATPVEQVTPVPQEMPVPQERLVMQVTQVTQVMPVEQVIQVSSIDNLPQYQQLPLKEDDNLTNFVEVKTNDDNLLKETISQKQTITDDKLEKVVEEEEEVKDDYNAKSSSSPLTSMSNSHRGISISTEQLNSPITNQFVIHQRQYSMRVVVFQLSQNDKYSNIGIDLTGGLDSVNKEVTVQQITPDSIADQDGRLQKGDRIISINGKSLMGLTHEETVDLLQSACVSQKVMLVYSRPNDQISNGFSNGDLTSLLLSSTSPSSAPVASSVSSISPVAPAVTSPTVTSPTTTTSKSPTPFVSSTNPTLQSLHISESSTSNNNNYKTIKVDITKDVNGLGFIIEGGKNSSLGDRPVIIKRIFRGGPVDKEGTLLEGDELVTVNEQTIHEMTRAEAWNFLKQLPDGKVSLVVRRKRYF